MTQRKKPLLILNDIFANVTFHTFRAFVFLVKFSMVFEKCIRFMIPVFFFSTKNIIMYLCLPELWSIYGCLSHEYKCVITNWWRTCERPIFQIWPRTRGLRKRRNKSLQLWGYHKVEVGPRYTEVRALPSRCQTDTLKNRYSSDLRLPLMRLNIGPDLEL